MISFSKGPGREATVVGLSLFPAGLVSHSPPIPQPPSQYLEDVSGKGSLCTIVTLGHAKREARCPQSRDAAPGDSCQGSCMEGLEPQAQ